MLDEFHGDLVGHLGAEASATTNHRQNFQKAGAYTSNFVVHVPGSTFKVQTGRRRKFPQFLSDGPPSAAPDRHQFLHVTLKKHLYSPHPMVKDWEERIIVGPSADLNTFPWSLDPPRTPASKVNCHHRILCHGTSAGMLGRISRLLLT